MTEGEGLLSQLPSLDRLREACKRAREWWGRARGARVLKRCDISRSIYGISSSYRDARNIEKCDISRSTYRISNTPTRV